MYPYHTLAGTSLLDLIEGDRCKWRAFLDLLGRANVLFAIVVVVFIGDESWVIELDDDTLEHILDDFEGEPVDLLGAPLGLRILFGASSFAEPWEGLHVVAFHVVLLEGEAGVEGLTGDVDDRV